MRLKYKRLKVFTFVLFVGLGLSGQILAQQRSVPGTVVDSKGSPLPGATVLVKGTTHGTVTNEDGNYNQSSLPSGGNNPIADSKLRTDENNLDLMFVNVNGKYEIIKGLKADKGFGTNI